MIESKRVRERSFDYDSSSSDSSSLEDWKNARNRVLCEISGIRKREEHKRSEKRFLNLGSLHETNARVRECVCVCVGVP